MLKLYNSLTRVKDVFQPITAGKVGLYTCGPTVYDYPHIGNMRPYIIWDVLKRWLGYRGLTVKHIMNITDVGHMTSDSDTGRDKMELASEREHKTGWELAEFYTQAFEENLAELNIIFPDKFVQATETIDEQIALALKLEAAGYLYQTADGMYFDTAKFPEYGQLARLNKVELKEGARVEINPEKHHPSDFAVWKFSPKGAKREMEWDSPWGKGFPGWHLECSAISLANLGETFDIHAGGIDHLTVHHPNEMAQSQAVTGKLQAHWWMHGAFLNFGEEKMSKSRGTVVTLDDLKKHAVSPMAFRFYILQTHYRKTLQFSLQAVEAAAQGLENLYKAIAYFDDSGETPEKFVESFAADLDNDLNTPQALAEVQELISGHLSTAEKMAGLAWADQILGLNFVAERTRRRDIPQVARQMLSERKKARAEGDFAHADNIRKELDKLGVEVKDTKDEQIAVLKH